VVDSVARGSVVYLQLHLATAHNVLDTEVGTIDVEALLDDVHSIEVPGGGLVSVAAEVKSVGLGVCLWVGVVHGNAVVVDGSEGDSVRKVKGNSVSSGRSCGERSGEIVPVTSSHVFQVHRSLRRDNCGLPIEIGTIVQGEPAAGTSLDVGEADVDIVLVVESEGAQLLNGTKKVMGLSSRISFMCIVSVSTLRISVALLVMNRYIPTATMFLPKLPSELPGISSSVQVLVSIS